MKNLLFLLLLSFSSVFALDGEEVFQNKCILCHVKSMESLSMEQELKAPPMNMIATRLKSAIATKEKFIIFVKDYIQHPSREKGYCMPTAFNNFGVMPAIGTMLSEQERDLVARWLYENFTQDKEKSSMKCGSGKCGGANMRCGASKCGSQ